MIYADFANGRMYLNFFYKRGFIKMRCISPASKLLPRDSQIHEITHFFDWGNAVQNRLSNPFKPGLLKHFMA